MSLQNKQKQNKQIKQIWKPSRKLLKVFPCWNSYPEHIEIEGRSTQFRAEEFPGSQQNKTVKENCYFSLC